MNVKKIHQIFISDNGNMSEYIESQRSKLQNLYDDYEYTLWSKEKIQEFLSNNYSPAILQAFNKIKAYAFKADLARYAILYKLGGYYFDIALCPEYKFEPEKAIIFKGISDDTHDYLENNILLFATPGNKFLQEAIALSTFNIKHSKYLDHPLAITSPVLLSRIKDKSSIELGECKIKNNFYASYYDNKLFCYHKSKKYQADLSELGCKGTNNYEEMWFNNDLYD